MVKGIFPQGCMLGCAWVELDRLRGNFFFLTCRIGQVMQVSFSYVLYTKIQILFLSLSIFLFLQKKKKIKRLGISISLCMLTSYKYVEKISHFHINICKFIKLIKKINLIWDMYPDRVVSLRLKKKFSWPPNLSRYFINWTRPTCLERNIIWRCGAKRVGRFRQIEWVVAHPQPYALDNIFLVGSWGVTILVQTHDAQIFKEKIISDKTFINMNFRIHTSTSQLWLNFLKIIIVMFKNLSK